MLVGFIDFLRRWMRTLVGLCLLALALLVAADIYFVDKHHAHTIIEQLPGFWALFGFVACVVIILASKWFGHLGIMTREDYYDE